MCAPGQNSNTISRISFYIAGSRITVRVNPARLVVRFDELQAHRIQEVSRGMILEVSRNMIVNEVAVEMPVHGDDEMMNTGRGVKDPAQVRPLWKRNSVIKIVSQLNSPCCRRAEIDSPNGLLSEYVHPPYNTAS